MKMCEHRVTIAVSQQWGVVISCGSVVLDRWQWTVTGDRKYDGNDCNSKVTVW